MLSDTEEIQKLEELIGSVEDLPTLPGVVAKISKMTVCPQTNAADIGKLISNDPALSSKILRLVNSSYYGFPRRISSVTKAIVLLGFSKVKNMAISASVVDLFRTTADVEGFDFVVFWQHAVATAVAAEVIAKAKAPHIADDAFVGGLLSNIGKVLLASTIPKRYSFTLATARKNHLFVSEAEEETLGTTSGRAASLLAEAWNFPELLTETLRFIDHPENMRRNTEVVDVVHIASCMVGSLGHLGSGEQIVPMVSVQSWRNLKLDEQGITELANEFLQTFETASAILELANQ